MQHTSLYRPSSPEGSPILHSTAVSYYVNAIGFSERYPNRSETSVAYNGCVEVPRVDVRSEEEKALVCSALRSQDLNDAG